MAQDEVASLKEQLKVAKMQYSQWADKTEADNAKVIAKLNAEVELYVALLNDAEKTVDYNEMRLNIEADKYVSQLYDAEGGQGWLRVGHPSPLAPHVDMCGSKGPLWKGVSDSTVRVRGRRGTFIRFLEGRISTSFSPFTLL